MFNRHRTDPDRLDRAPARDDRHAAALLDRTDARMFDRAAVRARLTASASSGLRDRLARPALTSSR
jgi:hypothetical protein